MAADPDAATTAALADVLTTALAKASAVPHATAGDAYRAGIEAIRPLIEAKARADERQRILDWLTERALGRDQIGDDQGAKTIDHLIDLLGDSDA